MRIIMLVQHLLQDVAVKIYCIRGQQIKDKLLNRQRNVHDGAQEAHGSFTHAYLLNAVNAMHLRENGNELRFNQLLAFMTVY